jgi:polysaccharide export outer membrane protein
MFKRLFFVSALLIPTLITAQSLYGVRVDDLSDTQIKSILDRGKSQGMSREQGEQWALSLGLSPEEAAKFKARAEELNAVAIKNEKVHSFERNFIAGPQEFLESELKDSLPMIRYMDSSYVYGHALFQDASLKVFNQSTDAQASPDYIMGVGDEIALSIYGTSFYQKVYTVGQDGSISMDSWGKLYVSGLTFEEVQKLIKSKVKPYFNFASNDIKIALSYSRSISVHIVGEVSNPGTYTFPALNSAFNALVMAGGPTSRGSVRRIEVVRNGKVVSVFDLYAFLFQSGIAPQVYLQNNDYLRVAPLGAVVRVDGEVRRPFAYELKPNETIAEALSFAGGISENGKTAGIEWYQGFSLTSVDQHDASIVVTGDSIYVPEKLSELRNFVSVQGGVESPGKYEFTSNMSLSDLIELAGGLQPDALEQAHVTRETSSKILTFRQVNLADANTFSLHVRDHVTVLEVPEADEQGISVQGAVRNPLKVAFSEGMTLGDALRLAGGLKAEADYRRVEVSRLEAFNDYNTGTSSDVYQTALITAVPRELSRDLSAHDKSLDFALQPYDQIVVREIPEFSLQSTVFIGGEVQYPGDYVILTKDEKLSSLINRSGGFTSSAFPSQASILRSGKSNVRLDLKKAINQPNSFSNISLEPGDTLYVPRAEGLVTITGPGTKFFVRNGQIELNAPYESHRRSNYYVNTYGLGFSKRAARAETYVRYPNGQFDKTQNYGLFRVYPIVRRGAIIHTVLKEPKEKREKAAPKALDWNQVVATLTSAAMGFGTVYTLLIR